ncbi:hypothetical protein Tco_0868228 [Tanacetum coccineum]
METRRSVCAQRQGWCLRGTSSNTTGRAAIKTRLWKCKLQEKMQEKARVSDEAANHKFLRSRPPAWDVESNLDQIDDKRFEEMDIKANCYDCHQIESSSIRRQEEGRVDA